MIGCRGFNPWPLDTSSLTEELKIDLRTSRRIGGDATPPGWDVMLLDAVLIEPVTSPAPVRVGSRLRVA